MTFCVLPYFVFGVFCVRCLLALLVDQLQEWGLSNAFGQEFRDAEMDGETLAMLSGRNFKKLDQERYTNAQFFHFDKLERKLSELVGPSAVEMDAEAGGAGRRRLAGKSYAGIKIASNSSQISMGTVGDVTVTRSGNEELTIDATTVVSKDLKVGMVLVGNTCLALMLLLLH